MAESPKQKAARTLMDRDFVGPPNPDSLEYKFEQNLAKLGMPLIKDGMIDLGAENIRRSEIFAGGDKKKAQELREAAKKAKETLMKYDMYEQDFPTEVDVKVPIVPQKAFDATIRKTGNPDIVEPFFRGSTPIDMVTKNPKKISISPNQGELEAVTKTHEITHALNPGYRFTEAYTDDTRRELQAKVFPVLKAFLAAKYGSVASKDIDLAEQVKGLSNQEVDLFKQKIQGFFDPNPVNKKHLNNQQVQQQKKILEEQNKIIFMKGGFLEQVLDALKNPKVMLPTEVISTSQADEDRSLNKTYG